MKLISIVALSDNNVIGIDNKMPWHLPNDLKFFKKTTLEHPIIMGRNTWLSIGGKPLPRRDNYVISSVLKQEDVPGAILVRSLEEALLGIEKNDKEANQAFIIGGGQLYESTKELVNEMYLTRVHTFIEDGMVFFPTFDTDEWLMQSTETHQADEKHAFDYTFEHWTRN